MFLGAGASITSGVPSAGLCVWEWKRDIFLTNNPGLEDQFTELSLPSVKSTFRTGSTAREDTRLKVPMRNTANTSRNATP